MSSVSKKKTRQYTEEYLNFGFIPAVQDERIPFCLLCQQFLSNESMKRGRLEAHLKAKHSAHINSDLNSGVTENNWAPHVNDIPMKNITSCAADGAPNMMGKKNGCLKLKKDANPEMILVHCVIHR
ncbi:uncharacterized protein TNCV_3982911 [Trichonephila clavipes]|nr:uncharacterized protein TNCV_3982911 [Trichonephila clavipes]